MPQAPKMNRENEPIFATQKSEDDPYKKFTHNYGLPADGRFDRGIVGGWDLPRDDAVQKPAPDDAATRKQRGIREEFFPDLEDFKENRSLPINALLGDQQDLKTKFDNWVVAIAAGGENLFREAYVEYAVLPSLLLDVLGQVKASQLVQSNGMERRLRSLRLREQDAKQALKGLETLSMYIPCYRKMLCQYSQAISLLRGMAENLPSLGSPVRGAPASRLHLKLAAYELARALQAIPMGRKKYNAQLVGGLLKIAFGYSFPSEQDVRKLVAEGQRLAEDLEKKYPTHRT